MNLFVFLALKCTVISFCVAKADERIFLTNLIDKGKLKEAKQRALVLHPEMQNVKSYAGYITINKRFNSNTFFWYFPSEQDLHTDPLILWMNGGPGSTSLFGLFVEHGPFRITENRTVEMRKYSWHFHHNIIYIDNPVGAGYSFTDDDRAYARTEDDIGRDVVTALIQFFQMFPELKKNDFYVTGESYAGKYVPAVSKAIKVYNAKAQSKINLKGLAIGNGWIDPINHLVWSDLLFNIGLLDWDQRNQVREIEEKAKYHIIHKQYAKASAEINSLQGAFYVAGPPLIENLTGFQFPYHLLQAKEPAEWSRYIDWVKRDDVRKAIHVGNTDFNSLSQIVAKYLLEDMSISHASYVAELLDDYKVLVYSGQLDLGVPWLGTEKFFRHLKWSAAEDYKNAVKKNWIVGGDVAGYVKVARNLNLVLVRNAGHLVPTDQPFWAWDLITRFTRNLEF